MIREAQYIERVPYMLIIGEKESNEQTVSVRYRDEDRTEVMKLSRFIEHITSEIRNRV